MPTRNVHGGKGFKKGKKGGAAGGADERAHKFQGRDDDQDYARIVRLLGDRRALCFCNDGRERVGKFRGAICKGPRKQIIRVGDIVLISYREFQEEGGMQVAGGDAATGSAMITDAGHKLIIDIISRYDPSDWRYIRKEAGLHPALLGSVSATMDGSIVHVDDIFEEGGDEKGADAEEENDDIDIDAI
jgi:initiation factor 1A